MDFQLWPSKRSESESNCKVCYWLITEIYRVDQFQRRRGEVLCFTENIQVKHSFLRRDDLHNFILKWHYVLLNLHSQTFPILILTLKKSSLHPCSLLTFCCDFINVFSLSSAESQCCHFILLQTQQWRHFKGQLHQSKAILTAATLIINEFTRNGVFVLNNIKCRDK